MSAEQCIDPLIARVQALPGQLDRHPGSLAPLGASPPVAALSEEVRGFDPVELTRIANRLGSSLGPTASHLVKTTAARSAKLGDLRRALAEHIPNQNDRASFLDTFNLADNAPSAPQVGAVSVAKPARSGHRRCSSV